MKKVSGITIALLVLPFLCRADDATPARSYKLDFVVQEVEGAKVINSREYSTLASEGTDCSIRTSSHVSVSVEVSPSSTQMQSFDVGVSIDGSHIKETQSGLAIAVSAAVTSLPSDTRPNAFPTLRKTTWGATVAVVLRKPTVIFSSDDVGSKHSLQLLLTATPTR